MNYITIRTHDIANGPGIRVTLFVSGCRLNCKGCFNKEAQDFKAGKEFTQETIDFILESTNKDYIKGLTILGGDCLEPSNQFDTLNLLKQFRNKFNKSKDVWIWTGRKWEELLKENYKKYKELKDVNYKNYSYVENVTDELLSLTDILIDGPFILQKKKMGLKYMGSTNQRIIDVQKSLGCHKMILSDHDKEEHR